MSIIEQFYFASFINNWNWFSDTSCLGFLITYTPYIFSLCSYWTVSFLYSVTKSANCFAKILHLNMYVDIKQLPTLLVYIPVSNWNTKTGFNDLKVSSQIRCSLPKELHNQINVLYNTMHVLCICISLTKPYCLVTVMLKLLLSITRQDNCMHHMLWNFYFLFMCNCQVHKAYCIMQVSSQTYTAY